MRSDDTPLGLVQVHGAFQVGLDIRRSGRPSEPSRRCPTSAACSLRGHVVSLRLHSLSREEMNNYVNVRCGNGANSSRCSAARR